MEATGRITSAAQLCSSSLPVIAAVACQRVRLGVSERKKEMEREDQDKGEIEERGIVLS